MVPRALRPLLVLTAVFALTGMGQVPVSADQRWISDILANPSRFWNTTVTVAGQVLDVTANPPGTTRGTYTLMDDSTATPLTIRTRDLPPVGREYVVTGVIIQDPTQAAVPVMDELERSEPGMDSTIRMALIGGAALLGVLLVSLIVMLLRPRQAPAVAVPAAPMASTTPLPGPPADFTATRRSAPAPDPTRKISSSEAADSAKTRVFTSLGYEVVVDKGPDKGAVYRLHKPVTTIGRAGARSNDITLSDDTVSKEQAQLVHDAASGRFTITNQSATNPTRVSGSVISEPVALTPDTLIEMGSTVLKFRKE